MQELKKVELFYVVAVVWGGNCLPNEFIVDTCAPLNFHLGGQIQPVWAKSHFMGQRHVTATQMQLSLFQDEQVYPSPIVKDFFHRASDYPPHIVALFPDS